MQACPIEPGCSMIQHMMQMLWHFYSCTADLHADSLCTRMVMCHSMKQQGPPSAAAAAQPRLTRTLWVCVLLERTLCWYFGRAPKFHIAADPHAMLTCDSWGLSTRLGDLTQPARHKLCHEMPALMVVFHSCSCQSRHHLQMLQSGKTSWWCKSAA